MDPYLQPPYPTSQPPYPTSQPPYPTSQPPYPTSQPPYPTSQPPVPPTQPPFPQTLPPHFPTAPAPPLQFSPPVSQTFDPYTQSFPSVPVHAITQPQMPVSIQSSQSHTLPTVPVQAPRQTPSANLEAVLRAFETGRIPKEMIVRYAESIGETFTDEMMVAGIQYIRENPVEFEPIYEKLVREGLFERYPEHSVETGEV